MSQFIGGRGGRGKPLTMGRLVGVIGIGLVATAVVAVIAILVGSALDRGGFRVGVLGLDAFEDGSIDHSVLVLRVPRVMAALLVGGALAGAGCALQALLRNPLAEPFTLGISSGASLGAVIAIRLGLLGALGVAGTSGGSLAGAAITLIVVVRLARIGTQLPPATLVLAGITISMFCAAATVLIQSTSDYADMTHMIRWMMGELDSMTPATVGWSAAPILGGLLVLVAYARELDALAAGSEAAASLGVAVERTERVIFGVSSLLVGVAIAVAGPIGFVGLIVPHALRALIGPDHRTLLPASVFGGAILVTLCDLLARTLVIPNQLPTGAITAVLGGPFFVVILVQQKRRAGMWART